MLDGDQASLSLVQKRSLLYVSNNMNISFFVHYIVKLNSPPSSPTPRSLTIKTPHCGANVNQVI